MAKLYYGLLDEAGILEKKAETGSHFIVSVVIVGDLGELKRVIKLARRRTRGKIKTHKIFKASKENKGFIKLVLQELSKRNIEIIIGVWDKKEKSKLDKNIVYAKLVAQTVDIALGVYPRLSLVVHKRYTLPRVRNQIDQVINNIVESGEFLSIEHKSEIEQKELELADAVAWAVYQKYNNKNPEFYNIIEEKIKKENRITV
ncbi:MAG: DUF3800 domain-containing protein [Parcubacteria group bacterium]|nr:DUF3800 domain-containing protein [Parcubacteria group bacterium]